MKITTLRPVFTLLLVLTLLVSCKQQLNEVLPDSQQEEAISLTEARQHYEALQQKIRMQEAGGRPTKRTQKKVRKADWNYGEVYKKQQDSDIIAVPIAFDNDLNFAGQSFKKMIFWKDKKNHIKSMIVEYILEKTYMDNSFGKLSFSNFTGAILTYDEDGNFLKGISYRDGKHIGGAGIMIDNEVVTPTYTEKGGKNLSRTVCDAWAMRADGCSDFSNGTYPGVSEVQLREALENCSSVKLSYVECSS